MPELTKTLEILRDANVKNNAMELSTETSYLLGQIITTSNLIKNIFYTNLKH